jgi:hypothetical protein
MDNIEKGHGPPRFVGLKVSNQVPSSLLPPDFGNLLFRFLDAIFSDIYCTKFDQLFHHRRRMGLADGDQVDVFRRPAAPNGRRRNPVADLGKS